MFEVCDRWALGEYLVVNAPEKCFVDQLLGTDIGSKHHEQQERQLELLTGVQGQKVHAAFERHDPAVQQVARRASLPAEIVDDSTPPLATAWIGAL